MRKALIAVAVATALFAVGAFAASFLVNSEDIASGSNDVVACAPKVDIDFEAPTLNTTTGAWTVANATATFRDAANAASTGCTGWDAELALQVGATYASVSTGTVSSSSVTFGFTATDVSTINGASVVVDGKTLFANP
jgi:hypothetical protein